MRAVCLATVICAGLAACTVPPSQSDTGPAVPQTTDRSMEHQASGSSGNGAAVPTAPAQLAAINPSLPVGRLVGMTGERISSLFGTPIFVRRDPPGEFWRYRGKSCVLELFFYGRDSRHRVDHFETRRSGGNPVDRAACLASLRKTPPKS
jgi:hypothetical protein